MQTSQTIKAGQAALASLPMNIANLLNPDATNSSSKPKIKRVVLLANNPCVTGKELDTLLHPDDLLILFNHFINAHHLANSPLASKLPKLLFFRQIGDSQLHFGLPPRHNHLTLIEAMQRQATIGYLFTNIAYQFPTLEEDPDPDTNPIDDTVPLIVPDGLADKLTDKEFSSVINEVHPVVEDYPIFEDIHSSAPSSGFFVYQLFLAIRHHLLDECESAFEIMLIGFNNEEKTEFFWHGHNWDFEREQMITLPEGVQRITAY